MKKTHIAKMAVVWLALVALPLPLIYLLDTQMFDTPDHLIAYDLGIVAYVWWLATIYFSTRPRWLAQQIGLPSLYLLHGLLGVLALVAATFHKFIAFSMFPLIKDTGNIAWYLEIFMIVYAILFLSGWLVDWVQWVRILKGILERHVFKHQVSIWLHRLNWLAVALIWLHVQLIARLNVPGFRLVFNAYTILAILAYAVWKIRWSVAASAGVVVKNEAIDDQLQKVVIRLSTTQPAYQAGDFYFVSFRDKNNVSYETHPFSVASAPRQNGNELTLTIHRLGDFTRKVSQIPVGTAVKLAGPFGQFDQEVSAANGPVILYGLGSGIAPLLSLANQYAVQKKLHLIWSGPQVNDEYYQQQLASLRKQGVQVDAQHHRFDETQLCDLISDAEVAEGQVIIVGSANRVLKVRHTLRQRGFHKGQLSDERMTM